VALHNILLFKIHKKIVIYNNTNTSISKKKQKTNMCMKIND